MTDEILLNPLTGTPISDADVQSIAELARQQYRLEKSIELLEKSLKEKKEELLKLQMVLIPARMEQVGMQEFTLKGKEVIAKLRVDDFYSAKISEENELNAFKWLRDNGHAGIVKTQVVCNYTQKEQDQVKRLLSILRRNRIGFDKKDSVHWQTLRAFVREMKEGGKHIPDDLFGVFVGKKTKLTILYEANQVASA
jgi:hypothetical protein